MLWKKKAKSCVLLRDDIRKIFILKSMFFSSSVWFIDQTLTIIWQLLLIILFLSRKIPCTNILKIWEGFGMGVSCMNNDSWWISFPKKFGEGKKLGRAFWRKRSVKHRFWSLQKSSYSICNSNVTQPFEKESNRKSKNFRTNYYSPGQKCFQTILEVWPSENYFWWRKM